MPDLHDLRSTVTTIADSLDISVYALNRLLNHKNHNDKNHNDVIAEYIISGVERLH